MKATSKIQNKDYSCIDYSKIQIKAYDFIDYEKQIKKVKYPTYPITNAEDLQNKIQSFKDDNVRTLLKKQLAGLNSYRKVRGDGNCFFRALGFYCLSLAPDPGLTTCFPQIKNVCLTCCTPESIPNQFKKFYDHKFLLKMLQRQWQYLYAKLQKDCQKNSRKALIKMFDEYPFLDFIVILYFRAICLKALWKQQNNLKQFLLGKQQQSIRTYSQQTEGVVINICSIMLNLIIHVYQIRKDIVKTYHYDNVTKKQGQIHLLFYQNHYDLIQKNEKIDAQKDSLSKTNYYSDVNKKTIKGVCVQCDRQRQVYEDSAICEYCFYKMQQAAKRYDDGDKLKKGYCQDCKYYRDDVLVDLGICKKCMKQQNEIAERRKKQEQRKSRMKKCIQCNFLQQITSQTGMCDYCQKKQQKLMGQIEAYQEKKKSDQRMNQVSPGKIRNNRQIQPNTGLNSDYYDKYRLKQTTSPSKQNKIGQQIKPIIDQYKLRQPAERDKEQRENISGKLKQQKYQSCSNCRMTAYLLQNTTICKNCYSKVFTQIGDCKKCIQKQYLYPKYQLCKDCYNNYINQSNFSNQNNKKQVLPSCQNCKEKVPLEPNKAICKNCYNKIYNRYNRCKICHYPTYVNFELGNCYDCSISMPQTKIKPTNQRGTSGIKTKCMKCTKYPIIKQSLCESCYKSHYCNICQKIKLTTIIINGRCSQCRTKF